MAGLYVIIAGAGKVGWNLARELIEKGHEVTVLEQDRRRRWRDHQGGIVEVVVDNKASERHTIIEVHAPDHLGLLRTLAKALADAGCDLSMAKVTTYGTRVVDVFYVRHSDGTKITDEDRLSAIARDVERSVLARGGR
jgi:UTP:GlnB (protein PII) uridylyltransferase